MVVRGRRWVYLVVRLRLRGRDWERWDLEREEEEEEVVGSKHDVDREEGRDNEDIEVRVVEGCVVGGEGVVRV